MLNPTVENILEYKAQAVKDKRNLNQDEAEIIEAMLGVKNWDDMAKAYVENRQNDKAITLDCKIVIKTVKMSARLMSKAMRERLIYAIERTPQGFKGDAEGRLRWTLNELAGLFYKSLESHLGGEAFTGEDRDELKRLLSSIGSHHFDGLSYEKQEALNHLKESLHLLSGKVYQLSFIESDRDVIKKAIKNHLDDVYTCARALPCSEMSRRTTNQLRDDIYSHISRHAGTEKFNADFLRACFLGLSGLVYSTHKDDPTAKENAVKIESSIESIIKLSNNLV